MEQIAAWYIDGPGWVIATCIALFAGWLVAKHRAYKTAAVLVIAWIAFGALLFMARV